MAVLAHAGHWIVDALYTMPVVVIVVWISVRTVLDRRREAREGAAVTPARAPEDRAPGPQG